MSLCDCDITPVDVFREKWVTARRTHKCCECGQKINPSDQYEYVFGVWEGDAASFHTCEKCADLRASMAEAGYCMSYGCLLEMHREYLNEVPK